VTSTELPPLERGRRLPIGFPDPNLADDEGLLAIGGDLSPERLLFAYEHGIFPWYDEGLPPMWWSPNPRTVMDVDHLHVSRSLRRVLRSTRFSVSFDRAFRDVILECGRERDEGTWILPEMVEAYCQLHELGHAHSVEVWQGERLVGGLYGVQRGALFAAESMFHRERDASKVALVTAVESLFANRPSRIFGCLRNPTRTILGARQRSREARRGCRAELRNRSPG